MGESGRNNSGARVSEGGGRGGTPDSAVSQVANVDQTSNRSIRTQLDFTRVGAAR